MFSKARFWPPLFLILLLLLTGTCGTSGRAAAAANDGLKARTEIFLIYKGATPIGYSSTTLKKLGNGDSDFARWSIESEIYLRMALKNSFKDTYQRSTEIIGENLRLKEMESVLLVGDEEYKLSAKSDNNSLYVTTEYGGHTQRTEEPYPMGAVPLSAAPMLLSRLNLDKGPKGRNIKVVTASPTRLDVSDMGVFVEGPAVVTQGGKLLDVRLVRTELDGLETLIKIDTRGNVYECIQPAVGLKQTRVSLENLQAVKEFSGWDVTNSMIQPAHSLLPNSDTLDGVDADLNWSANADLSLSSDHQQVRNTTNRRGSYRASVHITRQPSPPVKEPLPENERRAFLAAGPKIQTSHPAVKEAAALAAGKETDPLKQAQFIARWIHENIYPDPATWGNDHSASVTLDREAGMNKHTAILFAAMARSRGIPTRVATGMIYTGGLFIAHFWNEVYIDGAWMTVDATAADPLRPAPVRFKLAQGPDTEIAGDRAAPAMKSLRIDITGSQKR